MDTSEGLYISTDFDEMDVSFIHKYLAKDSYWAKGRSRELVIKSMQNSICFGVFRSDHKQIGFARIATDFVVFAWLMDVFIDESYKRKGIGKMLMNYILNYPELLEVKGIGLKTKDAHGLYEKFGFNKIEDPELWMYRKTP